LRRLRVEKVHPQEFDPCDRLDLEYVDGNDAAPALGGADALGRDLAPAAGRGAEVDDTRAGLEQRMLGIDLGELEGGAGAKPFAFGARHIGIVELTIEPAFRGNRAPLAGLDSGFERTSDSMTHEFVLGGAANALHLPLKRGGRPRSGRVGIAIACRIPGLGATTGLPHSAGRGTL